MNLVTKNNNSIFLKNQISQQSTPNFEQFPLDLRIHELTVIVLEYVYSAESAQAAPLKAREIWYRNLLRELDGSIDCNWDNSDSSNWDNSECYFYITLNKILDFFSRSILSTKHKDKWEEKIKKASTSSPFDLTYIFPIIQKIKYWIDKDLCTIFKKVFERNHIETGINFNLPWIYPANQIRNWINSPYLTEKINIITSLNLAHSNLNTLPRELFLLVNLGGIILYNNNLTFIPQAISNLKKLEYIGLDNNILTKLPSFKGLENLQQICLNNNELLEISPEIAELPKLEDITLKHNPFSKLPKNFKGLIERGCKVDLTQQEIEELLSD